MRLLPKIKLFKCLHAPSVIDTEKELSAEEFNLLFCKFSDWRFEQFWTKQCIKFLTPTSDNWFPCRSSSSKFASEGCLKAGNNALRPLSPILFPINYTMDLLGNSNRTRQ